jgi:hypothetical protein
MFCFRKNKDRKKFTSQTGLIVFIAPFFMVPPSIEDAHSKHGQVAFNEFLVLESNQQSKRQHQ